MAEGVLAPPTEEQREMVRREMERRRKIGDAHRGRSMSPEQRRKVSEGQKRTWAERRAAIEAVMREMEAQEGVVVGGLQE